LEQQGPAAPPRALLAALADACGIPALVPRPRPCGSGGRVWLLAAGPSLPPALVLKLRPDPAEVAALAALGGLGLPAPVPLAWAAAGRQGPVAGRGLPPPALPAEQSGLALSHLPGEPLAALLAGGAVPVEAWARALAELHAVPVPSGLPPPAGAPGRDLAAWEAALAAAAPADLGVLLAAALARLAASEGSGGPPVLCHGAPGPGHLLLQAGEVSGLLDWACCGAAEPERDLACAVSGLFAAGASARFALDCGVALAARYGALAGRSTAGLPRHLLAEVTRRTVAGVQTRPAGQGGGAAAGWGGLLGMCLARWPRP